MELSSKFDKEFIVSNFERNESVREFNLNMSYQWNDPYDSMWLKLITILLYSIELVESGIMMAFVVYETKGFAGHYRTLINQLLSHLYGGVSKRGDHSSFEQK